MATLIKQTTTHHVDAGGKRVPSGTPGAVRVSVVSKKWYATGVPGWPKGKRVPLAADRRAAEKMLADLVARAERGMAGVAAVRLDRMDLTELVAEFEAAVARKAKPQHVEYVVMNVRRVLAGCRFRTAADLCRADACLSVEKFLAGLGTSAFTAARCGSNFRQFVRWLWRKRKVLDADPFAGLDLPDRAAVGVRRAFTRDELDKLLASVVAVGKTRCGLGPVERCLVYRLAAYTGLRRNELRSLTADSFDFSDPPTVRVDAADAKNGRAAVLPLHSSLVADVRALCERKPSGRLFTATHLNRPSKMVRMDLSAAGIPRKTAAGRLDFHSFRHTFVTMVGRNAPLKVVQELARHSTPLLTVGRYSHTDLAEKAAAVAAMGDGPSLTPMETVVAVLGTLFAVLFAPPTRADANSCEQTDTKQEVQTPAKRKGKRENA